MFAYCRNNPVSRKDISGTTSVDIFDNELDLTDDDKKFGTGRTSNGGTNGSGGNSGKFTFKSESALKEHFDKHNPEFGNAFSTPQEYADAANYVIQSGEYVANQNAYVKFYGMDGRANYAFVGMSYDHSYITTFHLKYVSQIRF